MLQTSKANLRAETARLVANYLENGGQITKCPKGRRGAKTFNLPGSVASIGAKAVTLRGAGINKR